MTTIFDVWIRLLLNNDNDSRYLNSFINVNFVCNCETEISYFWYITFALTLEKTLLLQNNFWSNHRCETHLIEHFECETHLIKHFDVKRIWKSIRKYCWSNHVQNNLSNIKHDFAILTCKQRSSIAKYTNRCKYLDRISTCKQESKNEIINCEILKSLQTSRQNFCIIFR